MRVAVYCDLRYQRRDGALYCAESFAGFLTGLSDFVDRLVLVGRLDAGGGATFVHRLRDGVELEGLPDYQSLADTRRSALAMLRSLTRLWRLLGGVDAVWLLGPHPLAVACAAMALARRRRIALGVRENLVAYVAQRDPRRSRRAAARALDLIWRLLARAAPVVVVGSELAARYGSARRVVRIAPSLVAAGEIVDAATAHARDYGDELDVLAVGRLDGEKNPLLLADVLAGLQARGRRWRLVACGSGALADALARRLAALGVADRAALKGVVGMAELRSLYESSHALLHVSWTEGVPQVLFEAWAAGLPVVATDVGGVADAADGAALLIPPGDAQAAVEALARLARDPELRRRLVDAGFERVRRHAPATECARVAALLRGTPAIAGGARPPHRHMWVWAVLPPQARTVAVGGDAELAAILSASGLDVLDGTPAAAVPDAVLADAGGRPGRRAAPAAVERLGSRGLVAIALGGGAASVPDRQSRPARAVELLSAPLHAAAAAAQATALSRELRRHGLQVATIATGERTRPYGLGPGIWRRDRRLPVGRLVVGARPQRPPSVAETALAQAAARLGAPLRRAGMTVTESGKLMVDLLDPAGRPYILRVAAGPARPLLDRSLTRLAELAAADPDAILRERISWPLVEGDVDGARWALERRAAGRPAADVTERLWRECLDVLVALHACSGGADAGSGWGAIAAQADAVGAHVDPPHAAALERIARRLAEQLAGLPLGWAHGDFWTENLLVRHGRLNVIVDWDWAAPGSLPMLDLMDLIACSERRSRGLRPGPRLLRLLLPLARSGGDRRVRGYCERTGTAPDAETLEALAVAYWLGHVARDLRPFTGRQRAPWLAENVVAPLEALGQAGW